MMAEPLVVPKAPSSERKGRPAPHRRGAAPAPQPAADAHSDDPSLIDGYGPEAQLSAMRSRPASSCSGAATGDGEEGSFVEIMVHELEFGESVGSGVTAEVFRGTWKSLTVAIKQIYIQKGSKQELKQQVCFTREVSVLSKVNHVNLVKFYGVCFAERPLRLVTEFCEGDTLFDLLHSNENVQLVWSQQLKMCTDVAKAMHYLHSFNPQIIHRDLKSLNLLLAQEVTSSDDIPLVKVSDFGMARENGEEEWGKMTTKAGTCHWMAPEVLTDIYDEKADVYSYAMCLFEIVCREIPFEDLEGVDVVTLVYKGERPDLEAVPPDCPKLLLRLMISCWEHDPKQRPAFKHILQVLTQVCAEMATSRSGSR